MLLRWVAAAKAGCYVQPYSDTAVFASLMRTFHSTHLTEPATGLLSSYWSFKIFIVTMSSPITVSLNATPLLFTLARCTCKVPNTLSSSPGINKVPQAATDFYYCTSQLQATFLLVFSGCVNKVPSTVLSFLLHPELWIDRFVSLILPNSLPSGLCKFKRKA